MVEHWRQVARAAALGEHDFDAGLRRDSLDARQTHTLIGDIAATVRALVVLDQRYSNIPSWEKLHRGERLGWAALACALDASLEPPDYALDARGWRPNAKVITGPAKPGLLGVLQAEHNLTIRMKSFPSAMNLRLVVDSQRLLSAGLAPLAAKTDTNLEQAWLTRAQTYLDLQHQLRNIGGRVGTGGLAVTEAANAVSRLKIIRRDADLDPRALHAFTTLFARLDARIADIIEAGVKRNGYFTRVTMPRIVENSGQLVAPPRHRYLPLAEGDQTTIIGLVRDRLRPPPQPPTAPAGAARSRAELHSAIVHQPGTGTTGPSLSR